MSAAILSSSDPQESIVFNPNGRGDFIFTCEHGGRAVPQSLNGLNLNSDVFSTHAGCDLGAARFCLSLAALLDATVIVAPYSRLVIDLNRSLSSPDVIPSKVDDTVISRNRNISPLEKEGRVSEIYHPFHNKVDEIIDRKLADGVLPAIIPIHSYTPNRNGEPRPWHCGIMWQGNNGLAANTAQLLASHTSLMVGLNQPYSALNGVSYTLFSHGVDRKLPNLMIEIRQDLLAVENAVSILSKHFAYTLSHAFNLTESSYENVDSRGGHKRCQGYMPDGDPRYGGSIIKNNSNILEEMKFVI